MENKLTILLYHGVTASKSIGIENYSKKHIPHKEFQEQMKYISENCNVLSMNEVVEIVKSGKPYPEMAVAVTFDDGFKNNYTVAAPILNKFQIPTTFYISSGIINTDIMFWVDKLEDCINRSKNTEITIEINEEITFSLTSNEEKIKALCEIKAFCKTAPEEKRNRVIKQVQDETSIKPSVDHANNYEKMTWEELNQLNKNELFIIGGHSLYHNILSKIPTQEKLELDIKTSLGLLEYNLNEKIEHYSYPEGQTNHYNDAVIKCLKEHGIICSPSAIDGINDNTKDLFNLRRIMVGFMGKSFPFDM